MSPISSRPATTAQLQRRRKDGERVVKVLASDGGASPARAEALPIAALVGPSSTALRVRISSLSTELGAGEAAYSMAPRLSKVYLGARPYFVFKEERATRAAYSLALDDRTSSNT